MALTEKVTFLLSVNAKGVAKEFDKVGREADRSLGKAEERSEKLSATFTKVGAGMAAAGALAGAALYGMAQDASSFAETVDKAAILFGDGMDRIIEFSENAADSLGLAKDQALDAASTFAIYGKRAGLAGDDLASFSADLVTAAADMASFNDVPLDETIAAIGSALRGESEPLQRFGVDTRAAALEASALEAGLIGVGEKLGANETPLAVMAAITEQAADQMGNFALTADSAANQSKIMAAEVQNARLELGEAALPVLREVIGALADMASAFNDLPAPLRTVIAQTAVWGSALLTMGGIALTAIGRVKDLRQALGSLNTIKLGAAGIALAELALVIKAFSDDAAMNRQRVNDMADSIERLGVVEGLVDRFRQIGHEGSGLAKILAELEEGGLRAVAEAMADNAPYDEVKDLLKEFGLNGQQATMVLQRFREEYKGAMEALDDRQAIEDATAGVAEMYEQYGRARTAAHRAAEAADGFGGSINRTEPPVKTLEEAIADLNGELSELFGSVQGAEELQADFQEALDGVTKSIKENGSAIGTDTEQQRANLDARGDVIAAIENTVAAMIDEGRSADDIVAKAQEMVDAYGATALAATGSAEKADDLTAALDDIPSDVATELELSGYDDAYWEAQNLKKMLESMDRVYAATVNVNSSGGGSVAPSSSAGSTDSRPIDLPPLGPQPRSARSSTGFGMTKSGEIVVELTNITRIGEREIARSVERVSERDGGLRIKTRAGG